MKRARRKERGREAKRKRDKGSLCTPWMHTKVNRGTYWNLLNVLTVEMRELFFGKREDG